MTYLFTDKPGPAERSSFGEPIAVPIVPLIQFDAVYDIDPRELETFTALGGNVSQHDSHFVVDARTSYGGYAVLRSRRLLRYRPGQGGIARFTAKFENPSPNATLRAGLFTQEQALQVGYDGNQFGILRSNGGRAHIAKLELTAAAAGAETANLTLNGTSYSISISVANTITNATTIANTLINLGTAPWTIEQEGANVYFLSSSLGNLSGTFSYTSSGSSAGTVIERQSGNATTNYWTYQADWNQDKLDGSGASGMTLDPSKLNVFQINYRWLGVGKIQFSIEDDVTGDAIPFHSIHYTNRHSEPHLSNPNFRLGYVAANLSGLGSNSAVGGASGMAGIEGQLPTNTYTTGTGSGTKTGLTSGSLHHMLSLRNSLLHAGKINLRTLELLKLSLSYTGNSPAEILLALDAPLSRQGRISYSEIDYNSIAYFSPDDYTTPTLRWLAAFATDSGSTQIDLQNLNIKLPPNSVVSVFVRSSQTISRCIASLTWDEI